MSRTLLRGTRIAGIATCVPSNRFDNLRDTTQFAAEEVRKVVAMAGVSSRRVVDGMTCSTDLCYGAAEALLASLAVDRSTIDVLILVTQTPDYYMPSSSCLLQQRLGLTQDCAAFDVNLGCSGYVYGLWLAATMLATSDYRRVLVLHGETPTRYADEADRSVSLLFGDAGSATMLEKSGSGTDDSWGFVLHTDGAGSDDLIIQAGGFRERFTDDRRRHFVKMNGSNVFNFTIKVLPPLIRDALSLSGKTLEDVDYFVFHQSNQFIMRHIIKKTGIPEAKVPMVLGKYGNTGGPSVPLTMTQGGLDRQNGHALHLMLLGYGVGLSWGAATVTLDPRAVLAHVDWPGR